MPTPAAVRSDDDRDLAREGYQPLFLRGLGGFTAFAAGFSYLSILTGIVQNYYLGYREAGPPFIWTWPVVFAGQFCLALCFAELAREFPFCGGIYAWSKRAGAPFLGWMTGWVYLASLIVTLAAVALAWQVVLPAVSRVFQFVESGPQNAAILGAILIAISTVINIVGTRVFALIMNAGVIIELIAAVLLAVLLGAYVVRGPGVMLEMPTASVDDFGRLGPFLAAAVMAAYVMYGFDTAGTLAEETVDPRKRAPRAILQAIAAAAFLGMLLLVFAVMSARNLADPKLGDVGGGLPYLIKDVLGEPLGIVFILASVVAIFVCTLAVQANTARVLFAMARDRAIPGWSWLGRVDPAHHTPRAAAVVVGVLGGALLLFNMNFEQIMTALVCVCIVWANFAYLLTTGRQLARRLRGDAPKDSYLGRWGLPVNVLAVAWGVVLIVNIGWPRERFYGSEWYQQYGAPLYTVALVVVGIVVYLTLRRPAAGKVDAK